MSEILEVEEFSFKGIGSEGTGEKESSSEIKIELIEPDELASVDGCFLFILPNVNLDPVAYDFFLGKVGPVSSKVAVLRSLIPEGEELISYATKLLAELGVLRLKRITLVASEDGANVAQALCLLDPKLFRRAVLIDPRSRVHPTFMEQFIDKVESYLPVGLPFRASGRGFNSRPFLHRIRCPILVLISKTASLFSQSESEYIAKKIPNCYLVKLETAVSISDGSSFADEILKLLSEFQETSPKRPQKNR